MTGEVWKFRSVRFTALLVAITGTVVLAGCGGSPAPATVTPPSSAPGAAPADATLPESVIVSQGVVASYFPQVTAQAETGPNPLRSGSPTASRFVIYASPDGAKKVTISVDQYRSSADAAAAYQEAAQKSRAVPGFRPLTMPKLADQVFGGTVTQGAETHIGIGALGGTRIISATSAGYDATSDNIVKLRALTEREIALAVV